MDDLGGVNLSKFVSEAVAKLKSSDIQAAVQVCPLCLFPVLFFCICFSYSVYDTFSFYFMFSVSKGLLL